MTNERIVEEIQNGINVTDNMLLLYEQNKSLISKVVKKYTHIEPFEDLMQESFFGLHEAVEHYRPDENILFMSYATFWIKQALYRYIERCGKLIKIPSYARNKVDYAICSLGLPIGESGEETLTDIIQADLNVENDVCDKLYENYTKNELWGIVEQYTSTLERNVLIDRFKNNLSYREIGIAYNISGAKVRDIEHKALRRMKIGKIKRELLQKFDIVDCGMYRSGLKKFTKHENISTVEYIAMRRAEIQENYEKRLKEYGIV